MSCTIIPKVPTELPFLTEVIDIPPLNVANADLFVGGVNTKGSQSGGGLMIGVVLLHCKV